MSSVEEIKARLDIVDLVSETVQLRKSGKSYTGFCPFHSNTRTPAFVVFPDTGTWRCFGQCNEGGDIFKFVMKKEGWDFPEALRHLAERAGVQLRAPSLLEQAAKEQHGHLRDLLEEAVTFFQHQLLSTEVGKPVLQYLHVRGITDASIQSFGLGYSPDSFDALSAHLQSHNYTLEEMQDAGLLSERDDGRRYDRFRHRLMFPIRDGSSKMAGFGARALRDEDQPKYLNSPQNALFDKRNLLYGLDRARKEIRGKDQAVIVEGYFDVIALHQAGFPNAISPMGTALGEGQLRQLKRLSKSMVLALDADAAGDKATLRGLEVARQTLEREADPIFDARGLLHHEGRLQADIRVTTLPEGKDPDEIVLKDAESWLKTLQDARPIVEHVMFSLAKGRDLEDPKVKRELAGSMKSPALSSETVTSRNWLTSCTWTSAVCSMNALRDAGLRRGVVLRLRRFREKQISLQSQMIVITAWNRIALALLFALQNCSIASIAPCRKRAYRGFLQAISKIVIFRKCSA